MKLEFSEEQEKLIKELLELENIKFSKDNIQLIVVDLPLPFGPSSPKISPSCTSNVKSFIALIFLYSFVKFLTSTTFFNHITSLNN